MIKKLCVELFEATFRHQSSEYYGMWLSHIFKIPNISNEKPSISIKIPSSSIENLRLGFSPLEFEILGISSEIPNISRAWNLEYKVRTKLIIMFGGCFYFSHMFGL